jgi:hypothetical protein
MKEPSRNPALSAMDHMMVDIDCRASARYWSIGVPPALHCRTIVNAGLNVLKYRDTPRFGANKAFDSGSFHVRVPTHSYPTHLPYACKPRHDPLAGVQRRPRR